MTRFAERNSSSQRLGLLAVLVLLLGLVLPFAPSAEARHALGTPDNVTTERFAGEDRFETAGIIANDGFGTSEDVLIARGDKFPDALSGNFLAGIRGVPILLLPHDHLDEDTMDELESLGAENITILGQTNAISADNEERLEDEGYNVDRVGGIDRYETSQLTGEEGADEGTVGTWDGRRTAILPSGENFPDALVAGALAYSEDFPVLLTHPSTLPDFTREALEDLDIERVIIPGGVHAVSQNVEDEVQDMGIETHREFGANRVVTATEFADFVQAEFGWDYDTINLARGDKFPDALTIGPHAGSSESPILLTHNPHALGSTEYDDGKQETKPWLEEHACEIRALHFAGGVHAITEATAEEAEEAAEQCGDAVTGLTLTPADDTNTVGENHTVTATATESDGDDAENVQVRFEVTSDGNPTRPSGNDETDASGEATFSYTNDTAGDDTITACLNFDGSLPADCDDADVTATASKTWDEAPAVAASLDLLPEEATNTVGDQHTVTATVTDEFGNPATGVDVRFDVEGETTSTVRTTNDNGQVAFTYSSATAGDDTVAACTNADGTAPDTCPTEGPDADPTNTNLVDRVIKHWEADDPESLAFTQEEATNTGTTAGDQHQVTVAVTDQFGNAVEGAVVQFEVTGVSGVEVTQTTTDANGIATFTYENETGATGDDAVTACTTESGEAPVGDCPDPNDSTLSARHRKNWVA